MQRRRPEPSIDHDLTIAAAISTLLIMLAIMFWWPLIVYSWRYWFG